jgi:hypothetical protein
MMHDWRVNVPSRLYLVPPQGALYSALSPAGEIHFAPAHRDIRPGLTTLCQSYRKGPWMGQVPALRLASIGWCT